MTSVPALREVRVGAHAGIELSSDGIAIVVLPAFGGRVVSLVDRRSGREWLVQGRLPSHDVTAAASAYGPAVAWGWDECLPTVAPCPDPHRGGVLRDHGDVWGRPVEACPDGDSLRLTADVEDPAGADAWSFGRTIRVAERGVRVDYAIENRGSRALPVLWSMHPLVALEPGSRFHIPGITDVLATFATGLAPGGLLPAGRPARVGWPVAPLVSGAMRPLDVVPGQVIREAIKLYAGPLASGIAAVSTPDGSWLGYRWDVTTAPFLGVWISNGGWPAPESGVFQYALEPTTAAADSLDAALDGGEALIVGPGERRTWWVMLELGSSPDALADYLAVGTADSNPPAGPRGLE